ncbi:MAG: 2-oxoglutarate dehydrogenase E1 component, partial [Proteobacteria bacterium]|nr:2-oxoglutarate dehydrogenase E1 component [Pseudomonadota bacterium]
MADDAGLINEVLAETSFLYGGNSAFVEDLYAKWSADPNGVEPSWRAFFASLQDSAADVKRGAEEPAWTKAAPPTQRPDWLSAIDGLWPAVEAKVGTKIAERAAAAAAPAAPVDNDAVRGATLDSLRAIMMIRAYRMRGHLKANLDPLGIATTPGDASELDPATYGFSEADFDRPIFLDFVLGLETATVREILEIVRRTYCGNVGVQYMHISDPKE